MGVAYLKKRRKNSLLYFGHFITFLVLNWKKISRYKFFFERDKKILEKICQNFKIKTSNLSHAIF